MQGRPLFLMGPALPFCAAPLHWVPKSATLIYHPYHHPGRAEGAEGMDHEAYMRRALELAAALMGCPEDAVYEAGALAARLREALLNENAPAPQSAGDAEALARMGERRALSGLARALCERGVGRPPLFRAHGHGSGAGPGLRRGAVTRPRRQS